MIGLPDDIELLQVADRSTVPAKIIKLDAAISKFQMDLVWWNHSAVPRDIRREETDYHWKWKDILGQPRIRDSRWYEAAAVQTNDGEIQGAILYALNARSFIEENQSAVYVDRLATAPHNRPWLVSSPLYRGVGDRLLLRTVVHSYLLGFGGCVNLIAIDTELTVSFYQNRGFKIVGTHSDGCKMELAPEEAKKWLYAEGYEL